MHALIVNLPTTMTLMLCKAGHQCSYKVMWTWTDVSCAVFTPTAEAMISDMTIISKHCWLNPAQHSIFHEQRCHLPNIQSRGR